VERAEIISDSSTITPTLEKTKKEGKAGMIMSMKRTGDIDADKKNEAEESENIGEQKKTIEPATINKNKDENLESLEEFAQTDDEAICEAIACDFEEGDLCRWEASKDELYPLAGLRNFLSHKLRRVAKSKRVRRQQPLNTEMPIFRTWHNWQGRYQNRLTGIARAEIFSHSNRRFAAAYLKPGQRATLTGRLFSGEEETIRFRAWEATRDLRLRVCCEDNRKEKNCVWETDKGVKRGSRRWREHQVTCAKGSRKIIFECLNEGVYQGACGLDNIQLMSDICPNIIPPVGLHSNDRRRL
jgi:hypothetical protein